MLFAPDLVAVAIGGTVAFPNLDDTYHNVFSYSKTKRFDLGRYRKDEKPTTVVFDKPGAVTIHCEIHERMRGTILVLETPYFQKTDTAGKYRLEHLPPGSYVLKAWVAGDDVRQHPAELKTGMTLHVDFPARYPPITLNHNLTGALSFRAKLLLAMMLVVLAVTTAAVYLAEKNRRSNQQQLLA